IPENLEVVDDVALTFPVGDVDALRAQLRRLMEDESVAADLRRRTAERAAAWPDWDGVAERTEALYYQLLGRMPPGADAST
ncbi:MAG: glycosyltransferase family 1 protein, partial [Acidobacteriota bacterium]